MGVRKHLGRDVTVRDLAARRATLLQGPRFVGAATAVADQMEKWFSSGGCDGVVLAPTHLPGAFEEFVRMVVPVLQQRGLFRREYAGPTPREPPGLAGPESRQPHQPGKGDIIPEGLHPPRMYHPMSDAPAHDD